MRKDANNKRKPIDVEIRELVPERVAETVEEPANNPTKTDTIKAKSIHVFMGSVRNTGCKGCGV